MTGNGLGVSEEINMRTEELTLAQLADFRSWLAQGKLSRNTLATYNFRIESYLKFQRHASPKVGAELSKEGALRYFEHLRCSNTRAGTFNLAIAALSKLFDFYEIEFPEVTRMQKNGGKNVLSESDLEKFLYAAQYCGNAKARFISLLCYYANLSPSQCIKLNVEDIFMVEEKCYILRKSDALPVELVGFSKEWVANRLLVAASAPGTALLTNDHGERITRGGVDYLVKSVGIPVGLQLSSQLLRDTGVHYRSRRSATLNPPQPVRYFGVNVNQTPLRQSSFSL